MSNSDVISERKRCLGLEASDALPKHFVKGTLYSSKRGGMWEMNEEHQLSDLELAVTPVRE